MKKTRIRANWTRGFLAPALVVAALIGPHPSRGAKVYWTDFGIARIQRANLDGTAVTDLITVGLTSPRGIALNIEAGKMVWTDKDADKIQSADLSGGEVTDLIDAGLSDPLGIALDVAGDKMYWTDIGSDKIQRANLDGSEVEDLVVGLGDPWDITLDVAGGRMYWTDSLSGAGAIKRAGMDIPKGQSAATRTDVEILNMLDVASPRGIALDVAGNTMYWTDSESKKIQRGDLSGDNAIDLVTTDLSFPADIELDLVEGKMYWTDIVSDKVQRANLNGENMQDLLTSSSTGRSALALDLSVAPEPGIGTLAPGEYAPYDTAAGGGAV